MLAYSRVAASILTRCLMISGDLLYYTFTCLLLALPLSLIGFFDQPQTLIRPSNHLRSPLYRFYGGRTALDFLEYRALTIRVPKRWPSKAQGRVVAEISFDNGANPHMLIAQQYIPATNTMCEYVVFCWWHENIPELGFDLEDFVDKECRPVSSMIKQGQNQDSLISLFKASLTQHPCF